MDRGHEDDFNNLPEPNGRSLRVKKKMQAHFDIEKMNADFEINISVTSLVEGEDNEYLHASGINQRSR